MVSPTKSHHPIVFSALYGFLRTVVVRAAVVKAPPPDGPEPSFAVPIPNVTATAGRDVTLPCVVENLGSFRVAWIHTDRHTLLSLHDRLITRNTRYSISHNTYRTWWLHLSNIEETDGGEYMCQINTSPMKSQVGYLKVVVPPKIIEESTSSDTDVREGSDISLRCNASGSPTPQIKWRREDEKNITTATGKVSVVHGEYLNITKTSRLHMGAYLCIASNGVPPSVSKRILLKVNFPPMIWIPNQLVGAPLGTDVALDCNLESYPHSITYWTRDEMMALSNNKYDSLVINIGMYKVQMKLRIRNLRPQDFGSYVCVAKNSLGETEGTIRLYEIPRVTSSTATSRTSYSSASHQASNDKMIRKWQNSHNDVQSPDLSGGILGAESSVGLAPPSAEQPDSKDKSRFGNEGNKNSTTSPLTILVALQAILLLMGR